MKGLTPATFATVEIGLAFTTAAPIRLGNRFSIRLSYGGTGRSKIADYLERRNQVDTRSLGQMLDVPTNGPAHAEAPRSDGRRQTRILRALLDAKSPRRSPAACRKRAPVPRLEQ